MDAQKVGREVGAVGRVFRRRAFDLRSMTVSVVIVGTAGLASKLALGSVTVGGMVTVAAAALAAVAVQTAWTVGRSLSRLKADHARERETFDQLIQTLPVGVVTFREGRVVEGNASFNALIGLQPGWDQGLAFDRAVHPSDRGRLFASIRHSEARLRSFDVAFRVFAEMGIERHVQGKGVPIFDKNGGLDRVLAYFLDVTDTHRAQESVREKQASLEGANRLLREAVMDLESNFQAMVQAFVKVVEAKDPYTAGHSERVMAYSMWLGEAMGLRPEELRTLRMGCLVHDVGKIGVPDCILTKPGNLSDLEFAAIRQHPCAGVRIIEHIPLFNDCIPIVRHHHERLDGTGYPDRLAGDEIPVLARIAAVADCFDAMTSTRAYRNGMDVDRALKELWRDASRGALDPKIVGAFDHIVRREGVLWTPVSQAA